jgi:hypothetical protein
MYCTLLILETLLQTIVHTLDCMLIRMWSLRILKFFAVVAAAIGSSIVLSLKGKLFNQHSEWSFVNSDLYRYCL